MILSISSIRKLEKIWKVFKQKHTVKEALNIISLNLKYYRIQRMRTESSASELRFRQKKRNTAGIYMHNDIKNIPHLYFSSPNQTNFLIIAIGKTCKMY